MDTSKRLLVYAVSGCVWAFIAYALGRSMGRIVWGGVLASPLIGVLVGLIVQRLHGLSPTGRVLVSLISLYGAACLFGFAAGIFDLLTGVNAGRRIPGAVVVQSVLGVLWGLTFTGYFLVLWPLSYVNHLFIWNLVTAGRRETP